jgi:DNA polymerase delta subunit 1
MRLLEKLMCLFNLTEMARVTGVPISFLFSRGQQIKVASQLYRKAKTLDMVIPVRRVEQTGEKYEGAIVIDPARGYYTHPIATLDFASLYPSIMMAHNLCYTTLVPNPKEAAKFSEEEITRTPNGDYFIKSSKKKGILPQILEELISARKRAKKELKEATDEFKRAVLDGRQLALKISANSVYGFTGAQVGQLPCLPISSSVTAFGRQMIEHTKATVLKHYTTANGYEFDSEVIYGDTDSVMVKFGTTDRAEAMRLGKEAADLVSKEFINPIKLEFEKIYHPYLLMNKKRYAGMYWTNPDKPDKMDAKGIETVRRDNCLIVGHIVQGTLDRLLVDFDRDGAIEYCKGILSDLLQNRVDLSLLVITKSLSKKIGDNNEDDGGHTADGGSSMAKVAADKNKNYASNQAHVMLAKRMKERDAASAPNVGDRVAYVIVKGMKGSKNYEKSEDPIYVLENNLPIDYTYYIENQIKQPLLRIFEPIYGDNKKAELELFSGKHMSNISVAKVSNTRGLGMFTVVSATCMGCKKVLPKDHKDIVCVACLPKKKAIFIERKIELNQAEKVYGDLWVQCQRCQSSLHQDILCTSRDCPIFYRRVKAKKNIEELNDQLELLNEW